MHVSRRQSSSARLFRQNFGVETEVIPNPVELAFSPVDAGQTIRSFGFRPTNRANARNGSPSSPPLAAHPLRDGRSSPVGSRGGKLASSAARSCRRRRISKSTVSSHMRGPGFLRKAALFVHTSAAEGFPMTLLEAWSQGIPTVTTLDPGGTIARHGLGEVTPEIDGLVRRR